MPPIRNTVYFLQFTKKFLFENSRGLGIDRTTGMTIPQVINQAELSPISELN